MTIKLKIILFSLILFSTAKSENNFFPIYGKEISEKGYDFPNPFGVNLIYINMKQGINVTKLDASGIALIPVFPINLKDIKIDVKDAKTTNEIKVIKGDLWVFPFLNVYTLLGESKGITKAKIDLSVKGFPKLSLKNCDFTLNYQGFTYGLGTTLAGGYKNIFALLDINFSRTDLNIIDGHVDAFMVVPRIGYSFSVNSIPVNIWVGAMYQEITQTLKGDISKVITPPFPIENGKFEISEKSNEPWNKVVGMRVEFNKSFEVIGELGLGDRKSISIACGYRF